MIVRLLEHHQYFNFYLIFLTSSGDIVVFDLAGELLFTISQVSYKMSRRIQIKVNECFKQITTHAVYIISI